LLQFPTDGVLTSAAAKNKNSHVCFGSIV
jgi:hypothetical protein